MKEGQTQEPVGGMDDQCRHEWVGYKQCCYCGAYENNNGEVLDFTAHPQYPVKKLAEDFKGWYFSIKNATGKPPLAMQILYWFSKHLNLFDELTKTTPPHAPIKTEGEDEKQVDPKYMIELLFENRNLRLLLAEATGLTHYASIEDYKKYLPKPAYAPPSPVGIDDSKLECMLLLNVPECIYMTAKELNAAKIGFKYGYAAYPNQKIRQNE